VLEAHVQDVGLAALGHVSRDLQGHRRLARALRAADQQQLAGSDPAAHCSIERREAKRYRLVLGDCATADLVGEPGQHL